MKAVRFTGRQYSRSAEKELNCKAKTQHKAWVPTLTLAQTASNMSWHTPGLATCMISDIEAIKVPPAVKVLYEDWTSHYENDPYFQPHRDEPRVNKYVEIQGKSFTLHHSKVRTEGRICVPFACVKHVIKGFHEYAHPGVEKTLQIFNRSYVCFGYKPDDIRTMVASVDPGHARQATGKCGRERQEGDRGRRQGGDRKTTGKRQESVREATGSDRQATERRQGRCDRRATGKGQGGDRVATGRRQGSNSKQDIATG